jgi:ribosomal protein L16/L10AE
MAIFRLRPGGDDTSCPLCARRGQGTASPDDLAAAVTFNEVMEMVRVKAAEIRAAKKSVRKAA